jgi:hypothetical protein
MKPLRRAFGVLLTIVPAVVLAGYGLLVTPPKGGAANADRLEVRLDPRIELAALVSRAAGDATAPWPKESSDGGRPIGLGTAERHINRFQTHPAALRVRALRKNGLSAEVLAALLLQQGRYPDLDLEQAALAPAALRRLTGGELLADAPDRLPPATIDSLLADVRHFAVAVNFDSIWSDAEPRLETRAESIEKDPTLRTLTARLADFFGEESDRRPVVVPTLYGTWRGPFGWPVEARKEIVVVDRAEDAGKLTPETSLSWLCVREFSRPTVERLARQNRERLASLSGYWDHLKQGIAATTTAGWEDCFDAHLYRAIDLRVRPQEDGVERELRISSALQAGLGMIRALDAAVSGYDRGRNFYRRFTDYYPTLLEEMAGLEARVRVERPRLGMTASQTGGGLRIDEILTDWSAHGSGLRVGDVIEEASGRPIVGEERLIEIVQSHRLGDTIDIVVRRDGRRLTVPVVLTKGRIEYEFWRPDRPDVTEQPADSAGVGG